MLDCVVINDMGYRQMWKHRMPYVAFVAAVAVFLGWFYHPWADSAREQRLSRVLRGLLSEEYGAFAEATSYLASHPEEYNDAIAAALIQILKEPQDLGAEGLDRQNAALQLLSSHKERAAVPILLAKLARNPGRTEIAWALGQIGDETAVDALIAICDSKNAKGNKADIALGMIGGQKAVQFLVRRLRSDPTDQDVIEAIGETRDNRALDSLLQLWAEHKEGAVGMSYLVAISKVSDERGLPLLLQASRSRERWTRAAAAEGLGRTHSARALKRLGEMLKEEEDEQVWYSVTIGLALDGGQEATKLLIKELARVTSVAIANMTRGQPLGEESEYIDYIVKALAATKRASGLVAIMGSVDRLQKFGARRYVRVNLTNKGDAEACILSLLWSIAQLRGNFDLVGGGHFIGAADPGERLERLLDRHLTWWRKEGNTIRELAAAGMNIPFAKQPEAPYIDCRRGKR